MWPRCVDGRLGTAAQSSAQGDGGGRKINPIMPGE